jgi:hypothetical protein
LDERPEISEPADVVQFLRGGQRFRKRHDVGGLAFADQLHHMTIDDAMRVAIEVIGAGDVADPIGGFVVEQEPAKDRLFSFERMRWKL